MSITILKILCFKKRKNIHLKINNRYILRTVSIHVIRFSVKQSTGTLKIHLSYNQLKSHGKISDYFEESGIDVHIITIDDAQNTQNPIKFSALPETSTLQNTIAANVKIKNIVEITSSFP